MNYDQKTALYLKTVVVDGMGKGGENGGSEVYSFVNYRLWQDQDASPMAAAGRVCQWTVTHTCIIKVAFWCDKKAYFFFLLKHNLFNL